MLGGLAMPIPGCGATRAPACAPPCRPAPAGAVAVVQSAQRATLGAPAGRNNRGARGAQGRTRSARFACGAAAVENEFAVMDDEAEDFYQLLGVAPTATERDIKCAYHNSMRSCHPDFASSRDDEESATEVCVFLNDIYETLMDKEKRAAYDALAGFTGGAVNPFVDAAYERDHAFVDEFSCIGCRNCNNVCPKTFGMEDDYGRARVTQQRVDTDEKVQEAIDTCPVSCIHWVSAPQLTLLETVMARMERVDVWILMNGGGGGVNPFQEASLAWEKRQALLRRKRAGAQSRGWGPWGNRGGDTEAAGGAAAWEGARGERNLELQRATAVAAATAARRWRDLQRSRRQGMAGLLPDRRE